MKRDRWREVDPEDGLLSKDGGQKTPCSSRRSYMREEGSISWGQKFRRVRTWACYLIFRIVVIVVKRNLGLRAIQVRQSTMDAIVRVVNRNSKGL